MATPNAEGERSNSFDEKHEVEHRTVTNGDNVVGNGNGVDNTGEATHIEQHKATVEEMEGAGGLKGLLANPFVFATAVFASLGGLLFGCMLFYTCINLLLRAYYSLLTRLKYR
jgi:hypothetical protein